MQIAFVVKGKPVPQGSLTKSAKDGIHYSNAHPLYYWRSAIEAEALKAGATKSAEGVRISVQFGMPRPKAHLQKRGSRYVVRERFLYHRPTQMPDIDKLLRAVLDALTGICYFDDGQVIEVLASKVYAEQTYIEVSHAGPAPIPEATTTQIPLWVATDTEAHPSKG